MIRRLIILLLIVGCVFGDTIIYKSGSKNRTIENVEYTKAGEGKVYFKAYGRETSRNCNQIIEFSDNSGNPIGYDCSAVMVEENLIELEKKIEDTIPIDDKYQFILETSGMTNIKIVDYEITGDETKITKDGVKWEVYPITQIKRITDLNGNRIWENEILIEQINKRTEKQFVNNDRNLTKYNKLSLLIEGQGGIFNPDPQNFSMIYGKDNIIKGIGSGIGWNNTFFTIKYKQFAADGKSDITGIDLVGTAKWEQAILNLGLRLYFEHNFYFEFGYVLSSVHENIYVDQLQLSDLNSNYSTNNKGSSIAMGINIFLLDDLFLSGEVGYMSIPSSTQINDNALNIGGKNLNIGIGYVL